MNKQYIFSLFLWLIWYGQVSAQLAPTTLVSPSNNATNQSSSTQLRWNDVIGSSVGFLYELDTTPAFNSAALRAGSTPINGFANNRITMDNLLFGTRYYWRIAVRNTTDTSAWSATWAFNTATTTTLTAPSDNAVNQTSSPTLRWVDVVGSVGYLYELDTTPNFNSGALRTGSTAINGFSNNQTTVDNLLFGVRYYWRVAVRNTVDTSAWSTVWRFNTVTAPTLTSPSDNAVNQTSSPTLRWVDVVGSVGYLYELDTTPNFNSGALRTGSTAINGFSNNQATVDNLLFGVRYYWRVAVRNTVDTSAWSTVWRFNTVTAPTLTSPSDNAVNQTSSPTLRWVDVVGSVGYLYELDTTPNFNSGALRTGSTAINGFSNNQATVDNLLFGVRYYWRVAVRNTVDTSAWSTAWRFNTVTAPTLTSPSDNAVNQTSSPTLRWVDVVGSVGYLYELDTTPNFNSGALRTGGTAINGFSNNQATVNDLLFGTRYYWRVAIINTVDTSAWSTPWIFTTTDFTTLTSPSNNAVNQSTNTTLRWTDVIGSVGYLYELDTTPSFNSSSLRTGNTAINGFSNNQATVNNLRFGTTYYWRVAIRNNIDTSNWSAVWRFTTQFQLATAPTLIAPSDAAQNIPQNGQNFSWTSSTGATIYELQYSTDPNFAANVTSISTSNLNTNLNNLAAGTTYYWRVRGQDAAGSSPWSTVWSFTTVSCATFTNLNERACLTYNFNGTTLNSSGTYQDTIARANGCDSIIILTLTINQANATVDVQTACNSYTWIDGNTYTSSTNTPTMTLQNSNGCDSVVTLNLTITNSTSSVDVQTACNSYTWIDGNTYTSSTNTPTVTLQNSTGCDSIVTLNLIINTPTSATDVQTACDSYIWIDGNTYTSSTNTPTVTLQNSVGCDSVVTLNLTITNSTSAVDIQTACDNYTWIDGNTYTSSTTTPTVTLQNSVGCDSVVTLNLTITNSTSSVDIQTACGSYTWIDGNTYTSSTNTPSIIVQNSAGCDSTITLNLTITTVDTMVAVTGITLTALANNASYQWIDCTTGQLITGATSASFTPSQSGNYAVIVTQNTCSDTSSCYNVTVVGTTAIETAPTVQVYPNPSTGWFTIQHDARQLHYRLIDLNGRVVAAGQLNEQQSTQDWTRQASGVYCLELYTEEGTITRVKLVKQ